MSENRQRSSRRVVTDRGEVGWTFFRQWLKSPLSIAALSPSGRQLARHMVQELPDSVHRVVELGGGTGVFTRAVLHRGIAPEDLLVLELNEELYQHLRVRFPEVRVVLGDARELHAIANQSGFLDGGLVDAVLSGLGLLSMSRTTQRAIVEAAFSVLRPEGRLIQFTYGPTCPISRDVLRELGLTAHRTGFAWWNMPPASVYVITRSRSKAIHAVRPRK